MVDDTQTFIRSMLAAQVGTANAAAVSLLERLEDGETALSGLDGEIRNLTMRWLEIMAQARVGHFYDNLLAGVAATNNEGDDNAQ